MNNITKILSNLEKMILEEGSIRLYNYNIDEHKLTPLLKCNDELEINKLINKNQSINLVYIKILFGDKNSYFAEGPIGISCFIINKNFKKGRIIWFSEKEILEDKFNLKKIDNIVKTIYLNEIELNPFKTFTISNIN
jgi:hypothetical protein